MKTCVQCLEKNSTYNNIYINNLCGACRQHNYYLNRESRENDLSVILNLAKKKNRTYDCIVPVRADAEDYYIINFLISKKINPLVVLVNNYFLNDIAWQNYHNMITVFDVDSVVYNPEISSYKNLVRGSLRKFNSIYYPYKSIHHAYIAQLASEKKIPLIVWGQCQPIEFSGKYRRSDNLRVTNWWIIEHELSGHQLDDKFFLSVNVNKNEAKKYTLLDNFEKKNIEAIFLSNYMLWDQFDNNMHALDFGFIGEDHVSFYDSLENAGSSVYYNFHDLLRLINTGKSKIEIHLSRDKRFCRIGKNVLKDTDLTKFLCYQPYPFFRDFLDTTRSGYNWFLENRLLRFKNLIKEMPDNNIKDYITIFKDFKTDSPRKNYIKFHKGI